MKRLVSESLNEYMGMSSVDADERIDRYLSDKEWEGKHKGSSTNTYYRMVKELQDNGSFFIPASGRWRKSDWDLLLDTLGKAGIDFEPVEDYEASSSHSYNDGVLVHGDPAIADDLYDILQEVDPIYQ